VRARKRLHHLSSMHAARPSLHREALPAGLRFFREIIASLRTHYTRQGHQCKGKMACCPGSCGSVGHEENPEAESLGVLGVGHGPGCIPPFAFAVAALHGQAVTALFSTGYSTPLCELAPAFSPHSPAAAEDRCLSTAHCLDPKHLLGDTSGKLRRHLLGRPPASWRPAHATRSVEDRPSPRGARGRGGPSPTARASGVPRSRDLLDPRNPTPQTRNHPGPDRLKAGLRTRARWRGEGARGGLL